MRCSLNPKLHFIHLEILPERSKKYANSKQDQDLCTSASYSINIPCYNNCVVNALHTVR